MRLQDAVGLSKKLSFFTQTKVITLKTQPHAVNSCVKRSSQRSITLEKFTRLKKQKSILKSFILTRFQIIDVKIEQLQ